MSHTIVEPFRIKVVEPIRFTTRQQREKLLERAYYNPFYLRAEDVIIDLLTDSGTSAMSQEQWAGIMRGDESYAGASSFYRLKEVVDALTGHRHFIPVHQGRAAEKILFSLVGGKGKVILANTLFDTTRANVETSGATGVDLPCVASREITADWPFKGDADLEALEAAIVEHGAQNVGAVIMTVTNNSGGGQPVSLFNLRGAHDICRKHRVLLILDACRFAENAYFVQERELGQQERSLEDIAREMFRLCDGATFSGKKDGLVNMGGFLTLNDDSLALRARNMLVITEGFPTYGGMAGRDLDAMAIGLQEVLHQDYMEYRIASVRYLCRGLEAEGVPVVHPAGGHAAFIDACRYLPHIPRAALPGQTLVNAIYNVGGIRGVEIGSVMFGEHAQTDLVRLALPRRVYTQSHIDYVIEMFGELNQEKERLRGYRITWEPEYLRHFTAHFEPI
jgi:tryptophanase